MTVEVVDRFLRKMRPDFPREYTPREIEFLMRDTTIQEIKRYAPELFSWRDKDEQ